MAKRITSGKREREKIKQTKRLDKQRKREERQSSGSRNFEEMLAYVDENGVLHTTPPEVGEREEIDASQIEVSVPRRSEPEEIVPFEGRVEYFDAAKGYGFIRNSDNGEKYFFQAVLTASAFLGFWIPVERNGLSMKSDKSRKRFVFLCVAPATILFFIFMILPTLNVFRMSLYERGAYSPNETFVGLRNFQHLLKDTQFIRSMQNMILLVVVVTIITFAFALVFAAILTREKIKGQNFFRIIFYIPNILSVVVISGIFSAIYKPENGMLNSIIGLFRDMTDPILWKGEKLVIPSIIIAMVWQAVGYYMVMYMASMSSVPASLYESANLDGAGRLTQFFQITIPLVWTNIRTTLTFFIISTINMAFLFVKAMTSGGPNGASDVALNYMYSQKDAGLYGYSMAIGVVIFLFSFALSACVNRATSREPLEF